MATNQMPATVRERDARERAWLRAAAGGDRAAFEALYTAYHGRLLRFLARLTHRAELADEIVNDCFWIVWRKAGDFRGDSLLSTWILGIAHRCALKALRRDGAVASESQTMTDGDHPTDEPQADHELRDWLAKGLRGLPDEQRLALELAYGFGHSMEEIAEITDAPLSTVKARLFHARVKLRNLLPALGDGSDTRHRA